MTCSVCIRPCRDSTSCTARAVWRRSSRWETRLATGATSSPRTSGRLGHVEYPEDAQGWLGRHLVGTASGTDTPFRALTLGDNVTKSLSGYPAIGVPAIQLFGLGGSSGATADLGTVFEQAYEGDRRIEEVGRQALEAVQQVDELPASDDPDPVARAFADTATLLEADLGTEVVTVNIGGWDTHTTMGDADAGTMRDLLAGLDGALGGFHADLDARGVTGVHTVVMTEFGRRVAQNGSDGTDHGFGAAMLVIGDGVQGGRVHGEWPGLDSDVIGPRGDVPVTTDFRDVLGDLVVHVLAGDPSAVFPGHGYEPVGVVA
ncbi:MAG: DUF1501 domain-containing protein [Acidimicrobiia bacterium]|nr:DUF1501 domain-containing protein [Acidimicrobiia bacterium]